MTQRSEAAPNWLNAALKLPRPIQEFIWFGIKQAWACLFGALLLALIVATYLLYPDSSPLARYDFLVVVAVVVQIAMLSLGLETLEEAKAIFVFHVVGTIMEIFKTAVGSWVYPEASVLRIGGVPLFTGFMYASIGSYIARCWRLFDFQFTGHPSLGALSVLTLLTYFNFFAHHYVVDIRVILFAATILLFGRTWIYFRVWNVHRRMPLLLGFFLVATFIWFAENIGTFAGVWVYPNQKKVWHFVPVAKLGAWYLLMIISYSIIALLNGIRQKRFSKTRPADGGKSL